MIVMASLGLHWLEPPFMQRALVALLLIAPACAALGGHVIAFRMSFYSDAISHSTFTGIALGLLLGIDTRWSVLGFGVLIGLLVIHLAYRGTLSRDAVIGVLMSASVALGVVIVSMKQNLAQGFYAALYGDLLSVNTADLLLMGFALAISVVFEITAFNSLTLTAVNEAMARSHGVRTRLWETLLAVWVAVVVLIGVRAVGLLMVTALLIIPAAAGRNLARNASGALACSIVIALLSSFFGLALSYTLDSSAGATVILTSTALFTLTIPFARRPLKQ